MRSSIVPTALLGLLSAVAALRVPSEFLDASKVVKRQASSTSPKAAGSSQLSSPMVVSGTFDGKMKRFDRGGKYGEIGSSSQL